MRKIAFLTQTQYNIQRVLYMYYIQLDTEQSCDHTG